MKKKRWNFRCGRIPCSRQLCRIMKLTTLLLFVLFFQVSAGVFSQNNGRLSLKAEKESLNNILKRIEEQTEFRFMYNANNINVERKIDVNCDSKSITEVLDLLFKGTDVKYRSFNNNYVLYTDTENATESAQQQKSVSGKVTDTTGAPLPGVSVVIKGTTSGVITDMDGKFTLSRVPADGILTFSFVGMKTLEIPVADKNTINVTMQEEAIGIDEVVAIGYGSMEKKQVTSSISSLAIKDLPLGVGGSSIATALQGKIGGLVMSGTASPNSGNTFQLRGMASINTSRTPLIVIDGMPGGDIRTLVQEDIQSIDVLKDASAGAIYGTRATGGVILITTKQAKSGALKMSLTSEVLFKKSFGKPDMLSAADYVATYGAAKNNDGYNTDWWDEAMNDNPTSNRHVFTLQGGSEAARMYATVM